MYIFDTRERKNDHIIKYFQRHEIPFEIKKLDTGDYWNTENPTVVIDRKRNLGELLGNLKSPDSNRFWKEVRRAYKDKIKFIVLCEHGGNIKTLADVANWASAYSKVSGKQLQEEMYRVGIAYNVEWIFCDKRSTARIIYERLKVN